MFTAYAAPRHACPDSPTSSRSSEDRFDFHFGSPSSSNTSLDDFDTHYDDEWCHLRRQQDTLVHRLLEREKQHGNEIEAWNVRCQTLEREVKRLAALVLGVERERDEARAQLARSAAQGPLAPAPARPLQVRAIPQLDNCTDMVRLADGTRTPHSPLPSPSRSSTSRNPCHARTLRPATASTSSATATSRAVATSTATS